MAQASNVNSLVQFLFISRYASLLLVITSSLNVKLKDPPFCSRQIKRRPSIALSTCADNKLHSIFPALEPCNMTEIFNLLNSSFFIIPNMLPLWLTALDYFKEQRYVRIFFYFFSFLLHFLKLSCLQLDESWKLSF